MFDSHFQVPEKVWSYTPVHLMATAGLRALDKNKSGAILASCQATLSDSEFLFEPQHARILPGDLEGLYAWGAVNFATGKLQALANAQRNPMGKRYRAGPPTWGVFEMGGASLQVGGRKEARRGAQAG